MKPDLPKKGAASGASGPSLGRKRPRRAAVTRGATALQNMPPHRTKNKSILDSILHTFPHELAWPRPTTGRPGRDRPIHRARKMPYVARPTDAAGRRSGPCPQAGRQAHVRRSMTAVDFAAFIDELATVSGEAITPFFRTSLSVEDKSRGGAFDPVTAADRAAEARHARPDPAKIPRPWHRGRGVRRRARRCGISSGFSTRSTAPSRSSPACRPGAR